MHPAGPVKSLQWHGLVFAKVRSINIHESPACNKDKGQQGSRAMRAMNRNRPESVRQRVLVSVDVPRGHSLETMCRSSTCVCLLCAPRHTPVSFLAVWWGVQCTTGGPGRVSKEGRKNQRAGGKDPDPGVPGKSIKRNPTTLQNSVIFPQRFLRFVSVFQKKKKNMKKMKSEKRYCPLNRVLSKATSHAVSFRIKIFVWISYQRGVMTPTRKRSDLVTRIPFHPT